MTDVQTGETLFAEGKVEQAEKCFLDLLKQDPTNAEALNDLGVIQHAKGNVKGAEDLLLKAIAAKKEYLDARLNLVDLYGDVKRWSEAIAQLEKCIQIENKDPNLFNQFGTYCLEMGNIEKARMALIKSLELNPDQELVRDSLKELEKKDADSQIRVQEKPLNILFVQEAPCIRNYKMATALRARGHRVSLAYTKALLSQMYKGLSDDVYDENIHISHFRQLWDLSRNYDIVHCHNEPDILTVAALAGEAPVIHDTHDLISLRANGDLNLAYFEGVANRGATGRVYTTPYQMEEAQRLYGVNGPSMVFYNYVSQSDLPKSLLPKRSTKDGKVHIVYEGGIGGNGHRDFSSLFVELARLGNHVHIYPTFYDAEIARYFSEFPNIHYNKPLSPKHIIEAMSQFDFGIIPFNLEKGNKRFLDSTIANKLFEYLAAGLPVLASPLRSYIDYFSKNPVGITFQDEKDIIENIPRLKKIAETTVFSKQVHSYERDIVRLERFYQQVMNQAGRSEAAPVGGHLQVDSGRVQCHICGNIHTEEVDRKNDFSIIFCHECEVHFVHPMPSEGFLRQWYSEDAKRKRWGNNLGLAIKANHEQNREAYEEYYRFLSETVNLRRPAKVLEIGCYSGFFLKRLKDLGHECKGIDLNEGFLSYGREHYGLDLECGTLFDFEFPNRSFDLIIFHQVLEHLNEPECFLAEVRRVLKNRGHIFLSVPNGGSITYKLENKYLKDLVGNRFIDVPNHLFYFSKTSLKYLLAKTGFKPLSLATFGPQSWSDRFLKAMNADDQSLVTGRNNLIRKEPGWKDIEAHVSRAVLNTICKESGLLCQHLDDLPGLIIIAEKDARREGKHRKGTSDGDYKKGKKGKKRVRNQGISKDLIIDTTAHRPLLDLWKTQWLSTEELEEIQNSFLRMLVCEVYEKVPFYRRMMDESNIIPANVHSIEDLAKLPIIDKDIIHEHYAEMQHVDIETSEKHFTGTGGSTGKTLKYFIPPEVYYYGFGCRNRGFSWAGFDETRDKVAYLAGGSLGVTNKVLIEGNKLKIPATGITSRKVMKQYYEALKSFSPDYMRAYPSALYQFCRFLKEEDKELTLEGVVTTAETLFDNQRSFIEETLGCKIFNEYGAYDGGAGAFECEQHSGLHLQMERGIIELLDSHGKPVKTGQTGRVIVTDLHNYLFPFIRYDVGDMAIPSDRICKCGRGLRLIEAIEGRSSDYLVLSDGTRISGESVIHLFNKLLHTGKIDIDQYQVVQRADRSVVVKIIPGKTYGEKDQQLIQNTFDKHLEGLSVRIETVREIKPTPAGKMRFVFSETESNKLGVADRIVRCKKEKLKICHIGGAHTVHVADIMNELDRMGYEQCVIGYFPVDMNITPKQIPAYSFPYKAYRMPEWNQQRMEDKLYLFLKEVFALENPDIVHGHSLTYSCIPVWMAKENFGIPTVMTTWSVETMRFPEPIANQYERRCIQTVDYLLHPVFSVFKRFQSFYGGLTDDQFVCFRTLIDLSPYDEPRKPEKSPKILSARIMGEWYRQDLLIKALPAIVQAFPETTCTLIIGHNEQQGRAYFEKMIDLARSIGVEKYCNFIPRSLSQDEFAKLIRSHNIIYSVAIHDEAFSGTNLQAIYSGAVTIVQDVPEIDGLLDHEINVLRTKIEEESVTNTLIYAARDLERLSKSFWKANRRFRMFDREPMLANLTECYDILDRRYRRPIVSKAS